jgi:hypothetical protein
VEASVPEWLKKLKKKLPQPPHCGQDSQDRIIGGTEAKINEFSWMVLLEYQKRK